MIRTDEELQHALAAANNLRLFLAAARKTHSETDYHTLAVPILEELDRRKAEIQTFKERYTS